MIFVLLSWLALFLMISSTGAMALRGLAGFSKTPGQPPCDPFQVFWTGCVAVIAIAQLFSLFMPLNALLLILWFAASALGLPGYIRSVLKMADSERAPVQLADQGRITVLLVLAGLTVYCGASGVSTQSWGGAYDTDLYHFSAVRWMNEYAAIPGLANLHSRLGNNSGFLILSALLDNLWWDRHTAWLTNSFFITVTSIQWLWIILLPGQETTIRRRVFCLLTGPYLVRLLTSTHPTLYVDDVALLVQMVLFSELLRFSPAFFRSEASGNFPRTLVIWLMIVVTVAALGFSIKPIGALSLACALVGSAVFLARYALRHRLPPTTVVRTAVVVYLMATVLLFGHGSRNAILTGWLFYPAPAGNLHAEWSMPEHPRSNDLMDQLQSVNGQYQIIKAWARRPGPNYKEALAGDFSAWFPKWRERVWKGIEPRWLYIGFILVCIHLFRMATARLEGWREVFWDILLIGIGAANMGFWFLTAPDMRFGSAFFWIWMGMGGCMVLSHSSVRPTLAYILAGLTVLYSLSSISVTPPKHHPTLWHIGKAVAKPTKEVILNSDQQPPLVLRVPKRGDRCGDAELPCTPYPISTLQLRDPHCLQAGFKRIPPP